MKKFKLFFLVFFVLAFSCAGAEIKIESVVEELSTDLVKLQEKIDEPKQIEEPEIPSVNPKAQIVYLTADLYYFFEGTDVNPAELPFYIQLGIRPCKNNDPCLQIMVEQDGQRVITITDLARRRLYSYGYAKNGFIYVYRGEKEVDSTGKFVIVYRLKSKQPTGDDI